MPRLHIPDARLPSRLIGLSTRSARSLPKSAGLLARSARLPLWAAVVMLVCLPETGGRGVAADLSSCPVARELASKSIDLFTNQPEKGLQGLERAYAECPTDLAVGYNLGLGYYLSNRREEARDTWKKTHEKFPDHVKTHANLAWVYFDLGDDESAHIEAFKGLERNKNNLSLAHTKVYSLFRMGRYMEAYDWLYRAHLEGVRAQTWRDQAVRYVVETSWRKFRRGEGLEAVRKMVSQVVKEYPGEPAFVEAKDRLVTAELDPDAEVPFSIALPHEAWAKKGDVDDQRHVLDEFIAAQPPLEKWQKRVDAYGVFVGISQYKKVRGRHFADRDANNMRTLLTRRGQLIDDDEHVRVRINEEATLPKLRNDLDWLVQQGRLNPNAMLVFYYSGHGAPGYNADQTQVTDAFLVPVETTGEGIDADNAISLMTLKETLEKLPNQEIALLIDTCFNGSEVCAVRQPFAGPQPSTQLFASQKAWGVAAATGDADIYGPGRQRAFTYYLLKGMLGEADVGDESTGRGSGRNGWIDLTEAFNYTQEQIRLNYPDTYPYLSTPARIRLVRAGGEK
ncbi:MAG: caspase family protein [Magnetococcales bacterium]|nr:caspase family protein [Magnetococcales bacterium]